MEINTVQSGLSRIPGERMGTYAIILLRRGPRCCRCSQNNRRNEGEELFLNVL